MDAKKSQKADLENKKVIFRQIGLIIALAAILVAFEWKSFEKETFNLGTQDALRDGRLSCLCHSP